MYFWSNKHNFVPNWRETMLRIEPVTFLKLKSRTHGDIPPYQMHLLIETIHNVSFLRKAEFFGIY